MWFLWAHNSSASCCSQYSGKTGDMAAVWHQASREHMAWMAWHSTRSRMRYCRLPSGTVTTRSSPPDTNPKLHQIKLYLWAECLGETCLLRSSLANRLVYGGKRKNESFLRALFHSISNKLSRFLLFPHSNCLYTSSPFWRDMCALKQVFLFFPLC